MKPIILCSECRNEVRWGEKYCGSCGRPVEWPDGPATGAPRRAKEEQKKSRPAPAPAVSWKLMVGFAVFLVGGVVVLELLTGTKNLPVQPSLPPQQQGANMEAMNHLNELEQQVSANPKDAKRRLHLANFAHDNRFFDKAIEHYRRYLELEPRDADALVDLGICYNDVGNLGEAKVWMRKALEVSPKHVLAHFNLGIVHLKAGEIEQSNEWFRKTADLDPNSEVGKRAKSLLEQHGAIANP